LTSLKTSPSAANTTSERSRRGPFIVKCEIRFLALFFQALIGFATDITELKGLVQALRHSEARYRSLFDEAGVGTMMVELATCLITEVSKGTCHMLGYDPDTDDMVGMDFRTLVASEDLEDAVVSVEKLTFSRKVVSIDKFQWTFSK
jgi:PAS domain-containing protein